MPNDRPVFIDREPSGWSPSLRVSDSVDSAECLVDAQMFAYPELRGEEVAHLTVDALNPPGRDPVAPKPTLNFATVSLRLEGHPLARCSGFHGERQPSKVLDQEQPI
jgi:hypothetical protein